MDRLNVYEYTCYKIFNIIKITMLNNIHKKPFIQSLHAKITSINANVFDWH
jgi:hypothetical protein